MISDRRGIIDMPIKLAVCFLILGLMVPVVMDAVEDADDEMSLYDLRREASSLEDAIQRAYSTGSVVTHETDIPFGQSLEVGGEGGDSYTIRLCVDGETVESVFISNPTVKVIGGITVLTGRGVVTLDGSSAHGPASVEGEHGVEVSTA